MPRKYKIKCNCKKCMLHHNFKCACVNCVSKRVYTYGLKPSTIMYNELVSYINKNINIRTISNILMKKVLNS